MAETSKEIEKIQKTQIDKVYVLILVLAHHTYILSFQWLLPIFYWTEMVPAM